MKRYVVKVVLLFVGCPVACETPPVPSVTLAVKVVDVEHQPLKDAAVSLDGVPLGVSDGNGRVSASIKGPEGRRVQLTVSCPERYVLKSEMPREMRVRFMRPMTGPLESTGDDRPSTAFLPLSETVVCRPETQSFVLLVATDQRGDLPVKARGKTVSKTDGDGVAQMVLSGSPGQEIEVVIDTSAQTTLRPAMPSRRLTVPEIPQILVFEQHFKKEVPKRKIRKKKRRLGPRRI